ncbi:MAG: DNA-processing protein DprA [Aurantimicrobium sp.]|nr:DNA-processing protein DprA [Aurantimicrobium sp.]
MVGPVRAEQPSADEANEVFARAAWSGIVEPGDRVAGMLWSVLGVQQSLDSVISDEAPRRIADRVAEALRSDGGDVHENLADVIGEACQRWRPRLSASEASAHLERAARLQVSFIIPGDEHWPTQLDDLGAHRPAGLWLRGESAALGATHRSVSVVGARASTGYGEHVTMEIVAGLCDRGFAIVSGAAYGIDGMAHRAALASEATTVAVLAGGVDRLYPSGHDTLLKRIIETGAVVSELPCGWAPTRWRFLQRNRLIAALGQATAVMEAGWRSGSLNTAHHALSLDRPVGAVPGPVTSASSAGCHRLLRETPTACVTSAEEVAQLASTALSTDSSLAEKTLRHSASADSSLADIHPYAVRVVDALSERSARSRDKIARDSGLSLEQTTAILGLLSVSGVVSERATGWVRKSAPVSPSS